MPSGQNAYLSGLPRMHSGRCYGNQMDNQDENTPLMQMAVSAHELFTAFITAGFTEAQALQLVMGTMMASTNIPPQFPQQTST
jgi:hypothetical protein